MRDILRASSLLAAAAMTASMASPTMMGCGEVRLEAVPGNPNRLGVDLGETAVITGDYERVEEFLDEIDAPFTLYDGWLTGPIDDAPLADRYEEELRTAEDFLEDWETLAQVETLFINCGARGAGVIDPVTVAPSTSLLKSEAVRRNLRDWVNGGGRLYISDQSYNLLEAAIPEAIDFWGPDSVLGAALVGQAGTITFELEDPRLAITEDLALEVTLGSSWAVVHGSTEGVWIAGDAPVAFNDGDVLSVPFTPLMVEVQVGEGRVYFSSLHNGVEVDPLGEELRTQLIRAMGGALL